MQGGSPNSGRREQRHHERVRFGGDARLTLDTPTGITSRLGQVVDLSESGCAIRIYKPVATDALGWLELAIPGAPLSLPVTVRSVGYDSHSYRVGCVFGPLAPSKEATIRRLLERRRQRRVPSDRTIWDLPP